MINLLIVFVTVVVLKVLLNTYRFFLCKYYLKKYESYLKDQTWKFREYKQNIVRLFKLANIKDFMYATATPLDAGQVAQGKWYVLENLTSLQRPIPESMLEMFHETIGVFKSRIIESINPVFWLEFMIFLPKHVLSSYLGINSEDIVVKIFQLIYWLLTLILGLLKLFESDIKTIIQNSI